MSMPGPHALPYMVRRGDISSAERRGDMASQGYYLSGLFVQEGSIPVPLDWAHAEPGSWTPEKNSGDPVISSFYRTICAPEHIHDDLPLLVYLQGGPGSAGPRPLGPTGDGWIAEAIKHFRIVLPDQRGTGRSSAIDSHTMRALAHPHDQAAYLKHFLADSIVRDVEHLRRTVFGARSWVTLGQSYGGFLTLAYLSAFPEGLAASFTTGGIPHVPVDPTEVYAHTFPRMKAKTESFYKHYPQDRDRVAAIADRLAQGDVTLPGGDPLTVERFQTLGADLGRQNGAARLHWLLDTAFLEGDGAVPTRGTAVLSDAFLEGVRAATATTPLYWPLQEFIYADGDCAPIRWAGQRVRDRHPEFRTDARPLLFTGEAIFPWMFDQEQALKPFAPAVNLLMEDRHWGRLYDQDRLASNSVPLQAAVYFDDLYVDSGMQLDTLSRVGSSHAWVTNQFEHDGLHGNQVFAHLYREALGRGDLEHLF